MIDNFAIALTHALMLLAALIVLRRPELDDERTGGTKAMRPRRPKR